MIAIVTAAKSVRASLEYNEQKVSRGQARFLDGHNFWQDMDQLTKPDKLQRFDDLDTLNERSQKHSVHITLNFSPNDQLSDRQMTNIATGFMERIGFAEQPWLTYRHIDAGHPHLHIVSTNIQPDGSRITNDLRSPSHLKQLCYTLEVEHHLSPAIDMPDLFGKEQAPQRREAFEGETIVNYGKAPTKTEIARVLDHVVNKYSFCNFESYNAILSEYRVRADRGREGSPMYENKGLYYRVIGEDGQKQGAPIKASAFRLPVTLPQMEERFQLNEAKVQEAAKYMRTRIDNCIHFADTPYSLGILKDDLMRERVHVVIDHGFFYIDHDSKIAIRDTDLGGPYTAASVFRRTGIEQDIHQLVNRDRIQVTMDQRRILAQPPGQDPSERLDLLIKLSGRHDEIVDKKLDLMEKQQLKQRYGRGLGHAL